MQRLQLRTIARFVYVMERCNYEKDVYSQVRDVTIQYHKILKEDRSHSNHLHRITSFLILIHNWIAHLSSGLIGKISCIHLKLAFILLVQTILPMFQTSSCLLLSMLYSLLSWIFWMNLEDFNAIEKISSLSAFQI